MDNSFFDHMADDSRQVFEYAQRLSGERNDIYIGTAHLLLAIVHMQPSVTLTMLQIFGITAQDILERMGPLYRHNFTVNNPVLTPQLESVLQNSLTIAMSNGRLQYDSLDLFLALVNDKETSANRIAQSAMIRITEVDK